MLRDGEPRRRAGRQHGEAPHPAERRASPAASSRRKRAIHISNVAHIDPKSQQADPGRLQVPRGRPQGALRQALRRSPRRVRRRAMPARLQEHYDKMVRPALMKEFGYTNALQVPRLDKIVINMGVGEAVQDAQEGRRRGQGPDRDRRPEAGRSPRPRSRSRPSSCARTCRSAARSRCASDRMYEFLDRLINIALPRVRDFRGALAARASTAAAISRWASRNRSCFPRSITTRSTPSAAWTSSSARRRRPTRKRKALLARLRHAVRQLRPEGQRHGQDQLDRQEQQRAPSW